MCAMCSDLPSIAITIEKTQGSAPNSGKKDEILKVLKRSNSDMNKKQVLLLFTM